MKQRFLAILMTVILFVSNVLWANDISVETFSRGKKYVLEPGKAYEIINNTGERIAIKGSHFKCDYVSYLDYEDVDHIGAYPNWNFWGEFMESNQRIRLQIPEDEYSAEIYIDLADIEHVYVEEISVPIVHKFELEAGKSYYIEGNASDKILIGIDNNKLEYVEEEGTEVWRSIPYDYVSYDKENYRDVWLTWERDEPWYWLPLDKGTDIKVTMKEEETIVAAIPYEYKNKINISVAETPALYYFNLDASEKYKISGTSGKSFDRFSTDTGSYSEPIIKYDLKSYDYKGKLVGDSKQDNRGVAGIPVYMNKTGTAILSNITGAESMECWMPYEMKDAIRIELLDDTTVNSDNYSNVNVVVMEEQSETPIQNVTIEVEGVKGQTDREGKITLQNVPNMQGSYIRAEHEQYYSYLRNIDVSENEMNLRVYMEEKVPNKPYISSVSVQPKRSGTRELLQETSFSVDTGDKSTYTLTAHVDWQALEPGNIYLVGKKSNLKKKFIGNELQVQLGQEFPVDEEFYISAVSSDNRKRTERALYIDIQLSPWELDLVMNLKDLKLTSKGQELIGLPFLDQDKFKIDIDGLGDKNSFYAYIKDGKLIVGVDSQKNKKSKQTIKLFGDKKTDLSVYYEVQVPLEVLFNEGEWQGKLGVKLQSKAGNTVNLADVQHQMVIAWIPVVLKAKISAGLAGELTLKGNKIVEEIDGKIKGTGSLRGAGGIGAKEILNISLFGEGRYGLTYNYPQHTFDSSAELDFGVEAELGILEFEKAFIKGRWPREKLSDIELEESFKLIGRNYLEDKQAKWEAMPVQKQTLSEQNDNKETTLLLSNAFPNAKSKITTSGKETMMVFTEDSPSRTPANALNLVYSFNENGKWTTPIAIEDDETLDGNFDLKTSGKMTLLVWENGKEVLDDVTVDLEKIMANTEIKASIYDHHKKSWSKPIALTDNQVADFSPVIAAHDNKAVVAWITNDASDILANKGKTDIQYVFYEGNQWGEVQQISNIGEINGISVAYDGERALLTYDKDTDHNMSTTNDWEIFAVELDTDQQAIQLTSNTLTDQGSQVFFNNGQAGLVWANELGIHIADDLFNMESVKVLESDKNLLVGYGAKLIQNREALALLWLEEKDGHHILCGTYYDVVNNIWGEKLEVLKGDYNVKNFEATLDDKGKLVVAYLESQPKVFEQVEEGGQKLKEGTSNLFVLEVEPSYNVGIIPESITYSEENYANKQETLFGVSVQVTGEKPIQGILLGFYEGNPDEGGKYVHSAYYEDILQPGEVKVFETSYIPTRFNEVQDIYIKVTPDQGDEYLSDNLDKITIGTDQLMIDSAYFTQEKDDYILNAMITNKGSVSTQPIVVEIREDSENGNVIYTKEIDKVDTYNYTLVSHRIQGQDIIFNNDRVKKYYVIAQVGDEKKASNLAVITNPSYKEAFELLDTGIEFEEGTLVGGVLGKNQGLETIETTLEMIAYDENGNIIDQVEETLIIPEGTSKSIQYSFTNQIKDIKKIHISAWEKGNEDVLLCPVVEVQLSQPDTPGNPGNPDNPDNPDIPDIPNPPAEEDIRAFLRRLYKTCMGREADEEGLNYWETLLREGAATGASLANFFVNGEEFKNKGLSDREYIETMYMTFFDREADAGGLEYWESHLNQGLTREYVLVGFVNSEEYERICREYGINRGMLELTHILDKNPNITKFIHRFYSECMGRKPDEDGLEYWVQGLVDAQLTGRSVAYFFVNSQEFQNKNLSNEEFVEVMYEVFFGRNADSSGRAYWVEYLEDTNLRNVVLDGFVHSSEFQEICAEYGIAF